MRLPTPHYEPMSRTPPPWETTPWWHWRRWFGYSMRHRVSFKWGDETSMQYAWNTSMGWHYDKPQLLARKILAEQFDAHEVGYTFEPEEVTKHYDHTR